MNEAKVSPTPTLSARIASLSTLSRQDLWKVWDEHFPHRPDWANREYLESRLAYQMQAQAHGISVPDETRQRLAQIGQRHSKISVRKRSQEIVLAPGTVLIREWGEREHRVTVTSEGNFEYQGRFFKSLSAVARHITGTQWSGPAFFGLKAAGEVAQ